ncbi:MAG: hypothetical protein ABI758_03950 [Candidatus Woesebacteria bacterium]
MTRDTKKDLKTGLIWALVYQIFLFSLVFFFIFLYQKSFSFPLFSRLWNAWDGNTYALLAQHGYQTIGDEANYIVFYPYYPLLVGIVAKLGIEVHLAGMFVTIIGSIIGHTIFYLWLRERGLTLWQARRVLFLFCINPVTVYFTMICTEGVFLALIAFFFLFLYRRSFALAALFGLLASATRLVGITLLVPFVLFFFEKHIHKSQWKKVAWGCLIPFGFIFYLGINVHYFGNPFYYQEVLQQTWSKSVVNPFTQYISNVKGLKDFFPTGNATYGLDMVSTLFIPLFVLFYCAVKRKKTWLVGLGFTLANLFIITAQSYWLSNTRYISLILPLYVFAEELMRRFLLLYCILCIVFIIISLYGISLFARGFYSSTVFSVLSL